MSVPASSRSYWFGMAKKRTRKRLVFSRNEPIGIEQVEWELSIASSL
jgi:hypothetical protein